MRWFLSRIRKHGIANTGGWGSFLVSGDANTWWSWKGGSKRAVPYPPTKWRCFRKIAVMSEWRAAASDCPCCCERRRAVLWSEGTGSASKTREPAFLRAGVSVLRHWYFVAHHAIIWKRCFWKRAVWGSRWVKRGEGKARTRAGARTRRLLERPVFAAVQENVHRC